MAQHDSKKASAILVRCAVLAFLIVGALVFVLIPAAESEPPEPDAGSADGVVWELEEPTTVEDAVEQAEAEAAAASADPVVVDDPDGGSYASGEVLLSFDASLSEDELCARIADEAGFKVESVEVVSTAAGDGTVLALVHYSDEASVSAACEVLSALDFVREAEPDYVLTLCEDASNESPASAVGSTDDLLTVSTDDPSFGVQWECDSLGIGYAWETTVCDHEVTVVTIDSGVDTDHPDLEDNLILGTYAKNFYTNTEGSAAVEDTLSHGTHVAGTIAAVANNGVGIAGLSYNANILPLKVTNDSTGKIRVSNVIEALDYVVSLKTGESSPDELRAIRVVNMSLGSTSYSDAYEAAVERACEAGITIVAAAGNNSEEELMYPAAFDGVIGVSGLKSSSESETFDSSYSNYGSHVDLSAPGTAIYSTVLSGGYGTKKGTSMAAAVVSAVTALMYSASPAATPAEVSSVLEATALDLGDEGYDTHYGYGEVQAASAVAAMSGNSLGAATVGEISAQTYTGSAAVPEPVVELGGTVLALGTDYELSYENNIGVGTASVTVTGIGNYTGSRTVEFTIEPAVLTATYVGESVEEGQIPALEVSVTGFVDGETAESAAGYVAPAVETPQQLVAGESYELVPSGGEASNYVFEYVGGTLTVTRTPIVFVDVVDGDEANHASDIQWMANEGISTGWLLENGDREFRGLQDVARCDLAAFLYRMAEARGLVDDSWEPSEGTTETFVDVDEDTPHAREVWWMAENGITTGWSEDDGTITFRPYYSVARQDMAAFLRRFAALCGAVESGSETLAFSDVDVTDDASHGADVAWLASWGVTKGWGPDEAGEYEFRGLNPVARQDLAAFLHRLSSNVLSE